jgi:integrase
MNLRLLSQKLKFWESLYLYRFWDWNGDYVKGRLERRKTIGKRYVDDCRAKIQRHIEPFFKDTLLCEVTTESLGKVYDVHFGGTDSAEIFELADKEAPETKKKLLILGEIVRKERNILFHSFRHFFNSTIRGTVSDDILRLQTGHSDEKMTDHYDHMTDDRGEQLRKAVQARYCHLYRRWRGSNQ